ncbi:recombinase family protein [Geobacter pelophilus]|uniref:Recombinase family protein n=1 Tax=Geoanaerobacter pelophilus TaxID=60036 RepID=A0AAW4KYA2_9BACT|nr:recombinase family protein [Geoanaerobacter pelophilus]MBT0663538.1 recombinase family protein [Geoanaerobacter pelophilus]
MARAFSYTRFSRLEQRKGDSYRRQTEAAKNYADSNGLIIDESLDIDDLGNSAFRGNHAATGGLSKFIEAIENGYVKPGDVLLIENLDRLSRQAIGDAYDLLKAICNKGVIVVTLQDGKRYDRETLSNDFASLIIALSFFARGHEESLTKSDRVGKAWANKRKNISDKVLTKAMPAWLAVDASGCIVPIPERAEIVKDIYTQYVSGISPRTITAKLNSSNVDTWGTGKRKAKNWNTSYIQKILDTDYVIGNFTLHMYEHDSGKRKRVPLNTIKDYYPQVVPTDLYNRVREIRNNNKTKGRKIDNTINNIFSMVLRCNKCDSYMLRVNKSGGSVYLVCSAAKSGLQNSESQHKVCAGGYVSTRYDLIEKAFVSAVIAGKFDTDGGEALAMLDADIKTTLQQKEATSLKLSNIAASIIDGTLTGDTPLHYDVPRADGTISNWTVREEREFLELILRSADLRLEQLSIQREALKPQSVVLKLGELKRAVENESIDRARVNVILRAICKSATMDTKRKEIVFQLTHSVNPVVLGWTK